MRIVHVIDDASAPAATTLALLRHALAVSDAALLALGRGGFAKRLRDAGIARPAVIGAPMGRMAFAAPGFRSALRALEQREGGAIDLIHAWSIQSLTLAALVRPSAARLLSLTVEPSPRAIRWLGVLMREAPGRTAVLAATSSIRRALLTRGLDPAAVVVLRPGLDMGAIDFAGRRERRRAWGADEQTVVLAALCDQPAAGRLRTLGRAALILDDALRDQGRRLSLVVHPGQGGLAPVREAFAGLGRRGRLVIDADADRPWIGLAGCDIAVATGPGGGGLSLMWAMAANVPIVGEATYAVSELVEDRHSALLAMPDRPDLLAHRVIRLTSDTRLAWRLRDTARHEAFSFFAVSRYCEQLAQLQRQWVAGEAIESPALASTGGLRFSGRG